MEEPISLVGIFNKLKKRWKLIVCFTIVAAIISVFISFYLLTPVYQASTQILVNQKNSDNQFDPNIIRSNIDLIDTYSDIIKSPAIMENVLEKLDISIDVEEINKKITVSSHANSQVFSLIVKNHDPKMAVKIANTISETFQQEIKGIMNVDNVSILAKAKITKKPYPISPKPVLNIAVAIIIGMLLGIAISILLELMDKTIKTDQDAAELLNLPVLGSIPKLTESNKREIITSKTVPTVRRKTSVL